MSPAGAWLSPLFYLLFSNSVNDRVGFRKSNIAQASLRRTTDFEVIWSVPFQTCQKSGTLGNASGLLREAGVLINSGDTFQGDRITTFYTLGLYPFIGKQGDVNGGIPQLSNLRAHLGRAQQDIESMIPDSSFSGLAMIDWEAWRPVWEFNFGSLTVYQKRSVDLVRSEHPDWPMQELVVEAAKQWEDAAKDFMLSTLTAAKTLRPKARWCFYGFPDCYNYQGHQRPQEFFCSGNIVQGNDKLQWLWDSSPGLCPSLYVRKNQFTQLNVTQRSWYTFGRLQETLRVGGYAKPIYPYINYYIFDAAKTVPQLDFSRLLSQPWTLGLSGVVVWGSSKNVRNKSDCRLLTQYIVRVVAPGVSDLVTRGRLCSRHFCGSDVARCAWTKPDAYDAWSWRDDHELRHKDLVCLARPRL